MRVLLFILAIVAFLVGVGILSSAKSAIHEIEAFILFLIGAVLISGVAIVEAVNGMKNRLDELLEKPQRRMKKVERIAPADADKPRY